MAEEEDERECRVCRGPAEDGRILFHPCKCSGSIGLVHQDCLISWLKVKTNRNGKCDLCSTKFKFVPKYADGAPEYLPTVQVMICMGRRIVVRYMPTLLRLLAAIFLWLFFLPLFTAYLYQGWMHKPSSVASRLRWDLITTDAISGAVIAAVIIVSFLSLMSFVDFLRVHGDPQAAAGANNNNNNNRVPPPQQQQQQQQQRQQQRPRRRREDVAVAAEAIQRRQQQQQLQPAIRPHPMDRRIMGNGEHERRNPMQEPLNPPIHRPRFAADLEERAMEREHFEWIRRREAGRRLMEPGNHPPVMVEPVAENRGLFQAAAAGDINMAAPDTDFVREASPEEGSIRQPTRKRRLNEDEYKNVHPVKDKKDSGGGDDADLSLDDIAHMMKIQDEALGIVDDDVGAPRHFDRVHEEPQIVNNIIHPIIDNNAPIRRNNDMNMGPLPDVMDPDDEMDLDIHIALDELLGLRGPFPLLLRNLLWLSAFNTVFLGMFAFIPYSTGRLVCTIAPLFSAGWQQIFINYTHLAPVSTYLGRISNSFIDTGHLILLTQQLLGKVWNSSIDIIQTINVESHQKNNLLLLPDISLITLGYLSSAAFVLSLKFFYSIYSKVRQRRLQNRANGTEPGETVLIMPDHDEIPQQEGEDQIHIQRLIFGKLLLLLDIAADFSKVGILLLLKMLILPIFLGICLDLSTLCLFCATLESRVLFAAHDIFAAILVHWVVGITFMLVVTVSVLQLREVIHPDLLAPFVRPQEPQPDLLGNLLKDRGLIHAKRMLISLSIYLTILAINIWFPARMLSFTSLRDYMPLFRPKFYYILPPQLQIPIECLVFHLSMLSFLEKHKNQIGELQHAWLLRMGRLFGLTDHLMPRTVEKFVNIGFKSESDLSFWSQLTKIQDGTAFIYLNIEKGYDSIRAYPEESIGTSSATGKRVLSTMGSYPILIDSGNESKTEFPNVIGPYRLSQGWNNEMNTSGVYFWKEFRGPPIPRPPDGWDDLGFGGAEVQGRWAWGNERKSKIEECVAVRKLFFPRRLELEALKGPKKVIAILNAFVSTSIKSLLLFTFSWLGLILTVLYTLSGPVALGRWLFSIIHLSETYIHDPAAFALGSIILFPVSWKSMKVISQTDRVMFKIRHVLINIVKTVLKAFRGSTKNVIMMTALFLWLLLLPLSLGLIYDFFLSKLTAFSKTNSDDLIILLFSSWISGITLLHIWAALCYLGVFKVDFWIEIIDDIGADNGREQLDREDELLHVVNFDESKDNGTRNTPKGRSWQGKNGKIGRFFKTIIAVLCYSEWDKVDRTVLLDECCLPLFDAISISLFAPLSLSLLFRMAQLIYMGNLHDAMNFYSLFASDANVTGYRTFVIFIITVQIIRASKRRIAELGKFMHKAARDDKYLIGQVLLNYSKTD